MPLIFLMRHGQAEYQSTTDASRSLTDYGREYTRQIGYQFRDILLKYRIRQMHILHSPYRRAAETAGIITSVVNEGLSVQNANQLKLKENKTFRSLQTVSVETATPDTRIKLCFESLTTFTDLSILLVSHMPLVASLASYIEHGNVMDAHPFETSEIRAFEFEHWMPAGGKLKFRLA